MNFLIFEEKVLLLLPKLGILVIILTFSVRLFEFFEISNIFSLL